ncbi:unnamed protein product [Arctia plantaginis]|uniref:Uncharacterized protein n=1 Tax=Arctia plantaginis TaxID=874455 RepID=A0A8S1BMP6_ARCPL|nr:unnamed protein product [Arctia plantaginis]
MDENEEYNREASHGISFQTQPLSTQQVSSIHQSLPPTAPTHTEVKQEPVDEEDHDTIDIEEHPIETLKVEMDENEEYNREASHGISFQTQPLSTQFVECGEAESVSNS